MGAYIDARVNSEVMGGSCPVVCVCSVRGGCGDAVGTARVVCVPHAAPRDHIAAVAARAAHTTRALTIPAAPRDRTRPVVPP